MDTSYAQSLLAEELKTYQSQTWEKLRPLIVNSPIHLEYGIEPWGDVEVRIHVEWDELPDDDILVYGEIFYRGRELANSRYWRDQIIKKNRILP